jgi:hypothetical protein
MLPDLTDALDTSNNPMQFSSRDYGEKASAGTQFAVQKGVDQAQVDDFKADDPTEFDDEVELLAAEFTTQRDAHDARSQFLKFDRFRFQRSLGTEIETIATHGQDGYTIRYKEGDFCNVKKDIKFTSEVRYVCDPHEDFGKPVMLPFEGNLTHSMTEADCHYVFEHRTKYACSQCRSDQVQYIRGTCDSGYRDVHILPKVRSEKCIVVAREFMLADKQTELRVLAGGATFIYGEESFTEACDILHAAMENRFFVGLL